MGRCPVCFSILASRLSLLVAMLGGHVCLSLMNTDFVWRKLSTQSVLRTPYYGVRLDRLKHPQGHELDYYVLEFTRAAVGVVPVTEDGRVLLVQQWRHPVQQLTWSIPAGAIEQSESAADAAYRELAEETGHTAGRLEPLYRYHPTIGVADQTFHLFLASDLAKSDSSEKQNAEIHGTRFFARNEIESLIRRNEILDGMSLTALLLWLCRP
jgi:8-oxo-dGTP pyrophosphatase MutT (NUDIX family)